MRLKALGFQDFRGFATGTLDLSADVVAIYGRNGAGKTTVFDAIEFALFGSVSRLEPLPSETDCIGRVGGTAAPVVRLAFQDDTESPWTETTWNRATRQLERVNGSGNWHSHRDLLYEMLVDEGELQGRRDVSAVREMFRATLFQSQHSIQGFIEGGAEERARTLARLAGLSHIQRAREKADRVIALVEGQLRTLEAGLEEERQQLTEGLSQLDRLRGDREGLRFRLAGATPTLEDARQALTEAGLDAATNAVASEGNAPDVANMFLVFCDQLMGECDARSRRLALVESTVETHYERISRLALLERRRGDRRKDLARLDEQYSERVAMAQQASRQLGEARQLATDASDGLLHVRSERSLLREATSLREELAGATSARTALESQVESLAAKLKNEEEEYSRVLRKRDELAGTSEEVKANLKAMEELSQRLPTYAGLLNERATTNARLETAQSELKALKEAIELDTTRESVLRATLTSDEEVQSRAEVEAQQRAQLLSRLRSVTDGDTCPLCGVRHASEDALTGAIDAMLVQVPEATKALAARVQSERASLANVCGNLRRHEERRSKLLGEVSHLRGALDRCDAARVSIERLGESLKIGISEEAVRSRLTALRDHDARNSGAFRAVATTAARSKRSIRELDSDLRRCRAGLQASDTSIRQVEEKYRDTRRKLVEYGHSLDEQLPAGTALDAEIERLSSVSASLEREAGVASVSRRDADEKVEATSRERAEMARTLKGFDDEIGALSADIQSFRSQLKEAGFSSEATHEDIQGRRLVLDRQLAAIAKARDLAEKSTLRTLLDSVVADYTSKQAELNELGRRVAEKESQQEKLAHGRAVAQSWIPPLEGGLETGLERTIAAHQQEIERHFKAMIPAPHRFEGIAFRRVDRRLNLGVRYRGQQTDSGEPRMFLSNAQLNLLALAIFLSMGARQRWSRLETLLLDDPVQHLDDLDAVAFIDTLRAVSLGRFGRRRQIVISTCDHNLFQLIVQKFQPLQAVDTTFSAVTLIERGSEGPMIRQHGLRSLSSRSA